MDWNVFNEGLFSGYCCEAACVPAATETSSVSLVVRSKVS